MSGRVLRDLRPRSVKKHASPGVTKHVVARAHLLTARDRYVAETSHRARPWKYPCSTCRGRSATRVLPPLLLVPGLGARLRGGEVCCSGGGDTQSCTGRARQHWPTAAPWRRITAYTLFSGSARVRGG